MTDTVIKGSGNSRSIITVPNAPTLYPTHEELMQKWATEGIPIDLLGPNASGVDVLGTLLNKANLLTDATETAIWGNAANRTPDQALAQLMAILGPIGEKSAISGAIESGSFSSRPSKLYFSIYPKVLFLIGNMSTTIYNIGFCIRPYTTLCVLRVNTNSAGANAAMDICNFTWGDDQITISTAPNSLSLSTGSYFAIGDKT